ncbi:hypothetical protein [Cohnella panacarvi]|uniref:hypothetical protein n=1 Tax=Cohnella panacarvi TaxID=400776 RepID=UPI00047E2122|nr:hypothetical protein [Cohnella panacarvi]
MSVHAVSFQLSGTGSYPAFFNDIRTYEYCKVHETLWLVGLPGDNENDVVYNFLQKHITNNDFLVVIKVDGDRLKKMQGWVKPQVWAWLRAQA